MRFSLHVSWWVAPLIAAACGRSGPDLPDAVREQLRRTYADWEYPKLNKFNRDQLGPGLDPAAVRADFDGDGRMDWAVQIVHGDGPVRDQSVLVFLDRRGGSTIHVIQTVGENEATYLGVSPPGQHRDVVEDTAAISHGDVLDVLYGQEASVGYFYRNGRFVSFTTGD